jgi:hypothetical protein
MHLQTSTMANSLRHRSLLLPPKLQQQQRTGTMQTAMRCSSLSAVSPTPPYSQLYHNPAAHLCIEVLLSCLLRLLLLVLQRLLQLSSHACTHSCVGCCYCCQVCLALVEVMHPAPAEVAAPAFLYHCRLVVEVCLAQQQHKQQLFGCKTLVC